MSDTKSPVSAPVAGAGMSSASVASKPTVSTASTGASWWSGFVEAAKASLENVVEEVFAKIEPVAVEAFGSGISELEQIALKALTKNTAIGAMLPGPEKTEAAIIETAANYAKEFGTPVAVEVQQAVANAMDALGIAKAHVQASKGS